MGEVRIGVAIVSILAMAVLVAPARASAAPPSAVTIEYAATFTSPTAFTGTAFVTGLLGNAIVPMFGEQSRKAKVSAITTNLLTLRSQVMLFRAELDGIPPSVRRGPYTIVINGVADCTAGACTATGVWFVAPPPVPAGDPFLHGTGTWSARFDDRAIVGFLRGSMHCDPCGSL